MNAYLFFDLDGTLLDDASAVSRGLDALAAHLHRFLRLPRAELTREWHRLFAHHYSRYLRGESTMTDQRRLRIRELCLDDVPLDDADLDYAFACFTRAYREEWRAFDDIDGVLALRSAYRMGIVTNGEGTQPMEKLAQTGLSPWFDVIVTAEECRVGKPDARIFDDACRRAGVAPADAIYVGDSWSHDVVGGLAAGLTPIWLRRQGDAASMRDGVRVISTLNELPALLASRDTPIYGGTHVSPGDAADRPSCITPESRESSWHSRMSSRPR